MGNRVELQASITELGALRHTPAGLPALDLVLEHESRQEEAGRPRNVRLNLRAVAIGVLAERLAQLPVGSPLDVSGFLASRHRSRSVVLHIQDFNPNF